MSAPSDPGEYMTATEARVFLGIGTAKLAEWIKDGTLPTIDSPFHKRVKLVKRSDVERLAALPRPKSVAKRRRVTSKEPRGD